MGNAMRKIKPKTTKWDVTDYLKTDKDMAEYLEAAMQDDDPAVIATAIGNNARAKGMTEVARKAGIGRVSLYKALSPEGNPEFATVCQGARPAFACGDVVAKVRDRFMRAEGC